MTAALPLTPLEQASGVPLGQDGDPPPLDRSERRHPRTALADAIRPALAGGPCYVSFSGGRDSSAVLAVAVDTARRAGLPDPIPVSLRFPDVASTEESRWQELVIAHLQVGRWEIVTITEELDLLGAAARSALMRHGVLYPPNAFFHDPILSLARGGTVLTGVDGDGLFRDWRWARAQQVLHRRVGPRPRDALRVGLALAPAAIRRRFIRTFDMPTAPWLRPAAQHELVALAQATIAAEPRRWDRRVSFYRRARYLRLAGHSLALLGADHQARVVNPLLDPSFLAAVARSGGAAGYGSRTAALRTLFGDLLPAEVIARRTKGEFGRALWRSGARAFAQRWDGSGIDPERVDADRLRDAWRSENPVFGSSTLLHIAWVAAQRSGQGPSE